MKVATTFHEAFAILRETQPEPNILRPPPRIGLDIGKQFGTRIMIWTTHDWAFKLLAELEKRDLPCPRVIYHSNRIYIGVDLE